jgi:hypothetical protein
VDKTEPEASFHVRVGMFRLAIGHAVFLLTLTSYAGAQAAAIHKWVDEQGVTHYSDKAPASPEAGVTQLDISTGEDSRTALAANPDHYYSIANQWQRMNQERLQRQQLELQRAALSVERRAAAQPAVDDSEAGGTSYVIAAYPYRYHRPYRHHLRHRVKRGGQSLGHQPIRSSLGPFPTSN